MLKKISLLVLSLFFLAACSKVAAEKGSAKTSSKVVEKAPVDLDGLSKAYFASGCFWCVEAIFESVEGVGEVVSGYSGGKASTAKYNLVSSGTTKHAEAVVVFYDPEVVSYATLLKVFFGSHDPTTLNRQGPDRGPQYRSAIFYQNDEEKTLAEAYIKELTEAGTFDGPIVTEVVPFEAFYDAEDYHQDYEKHNPNNPYVQRVSIPRLKRFQAKFPELLKKDVGH